MLKQFLHIILLIFTAIAITILPAATRDWSDLDEGEHKIYGSEKEEKYPINAFILEKEKWENHNSFMALWLFKSTDYPKYTSLRILPFYYNLESKIDNRERTLLFPFFYNRIDGDENLFATLPYYSIIDKDEYDRSILYLFWWGENGTDDKESYEFFIPFLYYHDLDQRKDNTYRESLRISPFFFSSSETSFTDYYKKSSRLTFSLFHFYKNWDYLDRKTQIEDRKTTWFFPIIPITYHYTSSKEGHRNFLWLLDYSWTTNESVDTMKRFWLAPLWFWKKGENGYNHILPPVYIDSHSQSGEYYTHLLPFFISRKSIINDYDYYSGKGQRSHNESTISLAYCLLNEYHDSSGWEGTADRSTFWWPVIPVYYRYRDNREGTHTNILWLVDWHSNKENNIDRSWFIPFWFNRDGGNGYRHILPPVYMSARWSTGENYRHLLPLLYISWRSINKYAGHSGGDQYNDSMISLPYCSFNKYNGNEKWQGKLFSSTYWLPIIPLFYHSSHAKEGRHTNLLWLIDWHRNKDDNLDRLWLMPFLFDRPGENGYRHILLPLYISTRSWTGENYRHLLPLLYFSWRSIDNSSGHSEGDKYNDSLLSLLYCSFNKYNSNEKWEGEPYSSTSWFPVIPLFFRSSHAENGRHTNLLWLIDWKSDKEDNLSRFWFIPFIFHQTCDQGYRYYAPFYMRPSGNTEEQGLSFGLFHYHKWSLKKSVLWASLYFSMDKPVKKEHYIHFLPVFWTWKFKKSSGTIIIPWSITYEDKKRSVYINLLGFSKSAVLGPLNPDVDLEIGTYKGRLYLDTDTSWLYDVISFSTRISFKKPWRNDDDISVADLAERDDLSGTGEENSLEIQKPGLRSKREFDRENSEFFWGWKVLFGWMAYESGDSKRHFRLLPLSWFTWDKNSTDKLYTVPIAFLYYKSEDNALEYFALFPGFVPLFGYQIDRNSYKYGILLNSLWIEYDAEEDLDEITVLWPFINWYTSSKRSGWRVFPTFWYKKYLEDDLTISRYILLPLHYSRYERNKDGNVINEFVINPLYYSKRTTDESGSSGTTMFPILPLYYSSYEKAVYSYANKSLYEDEAEKSITGRSVKYITDEFSTVLGLFYMNDKTIVTEDGKEDKDSRFFLFGYYSHNSASINESSFLFGLVKNAEYPQKKKSEFELLYGLFSTSSSGEESKMRLMPFYYNYESPEKHELYLLLGLYWNTDYLIEEESNFYLFYGLYSSFHYQTSRYVFMQSVHKRVKVSTSEKWIIPLYYYEGDDGLDKKKYTRSTHIFWLWYWNNESFTREESKEELYTTTMWFPVIPLFYRYSSNSEIHWNMFGIIDRKISENYSRFCVFPLWYRSLAYEESHTNILGLIDWKCNKNEDLIRFWFLPIYLGYPGEESHHFIFPLLAYFGRSPKESTTLILGTYWHSSESYERQNILYLYDHKRYNKYDEDSYRFLLGTIHYETSPEVTEWDMLFGLLVDYKGYNNTHNYKFEFLKYISTWKRDDDYFQNSILPLWYYKEDSDSWSLLSPIGLSYLSEDQSGDFDLGLLGVLYYRNNKIYENEDTMAVLGGALYWERRKPERGYHSYGSLWGILLDYETESETGFKKLSILKGLYKRVEMNGEVKQKFLWIF